MNEALAKSFGILIAALRGRRELTQEALEPSISRPFLSEIERGLKQPTLSTLFELSAALAVRPYLLIAATEAPPNHRDAIIEHLARPSFAYVLNETRSSSSLTYSIDSQTVLRLHPEDVRDAAMRANEMLSIMAVLKYVIDVDIFKLLGLRNLSSTVGEVLASSLNAVLGEVVRPNPHQDGHPDLIALVPEGIEYIDHIERDGLMTEKTHWSPYPYGGIEVKATCGTTPAAREHRKLDIGESRIRLLRTVDWKAHHQETNNLLGIIWDFVAQTPTLIAAFYRNDLTPDDWGDVIRPGEGSRTTSVSIMRHGRRGQKVGVKKMGQGWMILPEVKGARHRLARILDI